jgi:hypothetical protein
MLPDKVLNCAALNVIWNLVAAQRFEYDDAEMLKLIGKYPCLYTTYQRWTLLSVIRLTLSYQSLQST